MEYVELLRLKFSLESSLEALQELELKDKYQAIIINQVKIKTAEQLNLINQAIADYPGDKRMEEFVNSIDQ
jgi:hypothetical protein